MLTRVVKTTHALQIRQVSEVPASGGGMSPVFEVDLDERSKMDRAGSRIADLRNQTPPVKWGTITKLVGLSWGKCFDAYKAWKTLNVT